jgi:regulator of protease activity HflC (stomatin/prohibitin superfamily)
MMQQDWMSLFGGTAVGIVGLVLMAIIGRNFGISVEDEEIVLVTEFGKLTARLSKPGFHFWPKQWLPWVKIHRVSLARDFRVIHDLHVNDARGTTVIATLWVEQRIVDAEKALFAVEDWEQATQNIVVHAAMSILGSRDFQEILDDRNELASRLQHDVSKETERWGVKVERVFVRHVSLNPDVARQVFDSVAARLESAQALVLEQGRLDVAALEAQTSKSVAALTAETKSQYALAIGAAYESLKKQPAVFDAYKALHELAQVNAQRTVAFRGFGSDGVRAVDAAMLPDGGAEVLKVGSATGTSD